MTVPVQVPFTASTANGVTTSFPYSFKIASADDLVVEVDGVVVTTGFSVTGVGVTAGGNVLFVTPPDNGAKVVRYRKPVMKRTTDYQQFGDWNAGTVNPDFDSLWLVAQYLEHAYGRAIKLPVDTADDQVITEDATDRALQGVGFDALGKLKLYPLQAGAFLVDLAVSTGSSLIGWIQSGTGAVIRTINDKLRGLVDIQDFGVTLDGTDAAGNLTKFQAAINYCQDNLKTLRINSSNPSATIAVGGTLSITKPLRMIGDGQHQVTIQGSGLGVGQYVLDVDGTAYGTFEQAEIGGFTLMGNGTCDLMRIKNASVSRFFDLGLRGARYGIVYTGTRCFSNVFERIYPITGITTSTVVITAHTGGGHHSFYDATFGGATGISVSSDTTIDSLNFYDCNWEQCTVNSLSISGNVAGLGIHGGRTEGCDSTDFLINPGAGKTVSGIDIHGVTFGSSDSGGSDRIILGGAGGKVRGFNIAGNTVAHGSNNFSAKLVQLNGDGESGLIANNYLDGLLANCGPVNAGRAGVTVINNEANNGKCTELWNGLPWAVTGGSWTPADASGAGLTFSAAVGRYTRTGRMVFWEALIVYPATANGASASISGLPLTYADDGSVGRAGANVSATDSAVVGVLRVGANLNLYKSGLVAATNADMSGKQIYLSGVMTTTAA